MKFSPKCRTKKLGIKTPFWENFAHFLNWKGPITGPKSGLGKSLDIYILPLTLTDIFDMDVLSCTAGCSLMQNEGSLDISAHNNFGPCQFRPIANRPIQFRPTGIIMYNWYQRSRKRRIRRIFTPTFGFVRILFLLGILIYANFLFC